ncbi:penicillin-binding protein 2 [Selenomonadales bacterium OttesenSCG-928-I06]|nr:penicillin-binding protein 2 [Selenomonadales bacterium OttesenSCG-928-I06]
MSFYSSRLKFLLIMFFVLISLISARLLFLQLIIGQELAIEAIRVRNQEIPLNIARGDILDKNGILLTNTSQKYSVFIFPNEISDIKTTIETLNNITNIPLSSLEKLYLKNNVPFRLITDLDSATAQRINDLNLKGVISISETTRYNNNSLAAHIIGYINKADNKGVSGIEKTYDDFLKGNDSFYVTATLDAEADIIPGLGYKVFKSTTNNVQHNVILTIDKQLQEEVESIMDSYVKKGAIVVLKPDTGEILAIASRPNFNANKLERYLYEESAPLLNRAFLAYQPGSIFKIIVAAAAFEDKKNNFDIDTNFFDQGYIEVNGTTFWSWEYEQYGSRGTITLTDAMAFSSNPVFIEIALKLGAEDVINMAKKMGLGSITNLNFDNEQEGRLPNPQGIYQAELANLAIGQGICEATPIQLAQVLSIIANNGIKKDLRVIDKIVDNEGNIIRDYKNIDQQKERVISLKTAQKLQKMLFAVTTYGTGQQAQIEEYKSAGKTGSAETGIKDEKGRSISHAWFAGYTPYDDPKYVVVVFVENGMSGGEIAAPIFQKIATKALALDS